MAGTDGRRAGPEENDPADVAVFRDEARFALVAAVRRLPPRQRAALFLRDVLRWRAKEVADLLGVTVPSVNSALQRARATLAARKAGDTDRTASFDKANRALVARLLNALARDDFDAIVAVLHEDVTRSRRSQQSRATVQPAVVAPNLAEVIAGRHGAPAGPTFDERIESTVTASTQ